jgi:hypothetical protein
MYKYCGPGSSVSIAAGYGLDGPGIESIGTQDRGFVPDRSRRIFPAGKIHRMPSFGRGSKIICPMLVTRTTVGQKGQKLQLWYKKIPGGGEIFRKRPDRPWGLLHDGYRVFPEGKAAGAWC